MKRALVAVLSAFIAQLACAQGIQEQRLAFIQKLIQRGVFQKLEKPASLCRLWTGPVFADLTFDDKSQFVNVVYAYCVTHDSRANIVVLKDGKTGKDIGTYSETNPGLRLK